MYIPLISLIVLTCVSLASLTAVVYCIFMPYSPCSSSGVVLLSCYYVRLEVFDHLVLLITKCEFENFTGTLKKKKWGIVNY